MAYNPQLNKHGELQHLHTIEGLPRAIITQILDTAAPFTEVAEREVKKLPLLRARACFNLFFENSTRTRTTFEIAANASPRRDQLNVVHQFHPKGKPCWTRWTTCAPCRRHVRGAPRHDRCALPERPAPGRHRRDHIHVINAATGATRTDPGPA